MGMRRLALVAVGFWLGVTPGHCGAQAAATDPLEHGHLVVWVVQPAPPRRPTADQVRATLHTATAGNFGQTAGSVGQSAGSYGTDSGSFAGVSTSRSAVDAGQPAGSFGEGLSTISAASTAANGTLPAPPAFEPAALGPAWESFAHTLRSNFRALDATFLAVNAADLPQRLALAARGNGLPDVLLAHSSLRREGTPLAEFTLARLGRPANLATPFQTGNGLPQLQWLLLAGAAHPAQARAFVVWLEDDQWAHLERTPLNSKLGGPVAEAVEAVDAALGGGVVPNADPEAAEVPAGALRWSAFLPWEPGAVEGLTLHTAVLEWAANERFAVYALRTVAESAGAFGVAHPLVVLRRGVDRRWRVLQLSANLPARDRFDEFGGLALFAQPVAPELVRPARPVTLATPPDGDIRTVGSELWWDDPGDAPLLVVEWQAPPGDTHLQMVPDGGPKLQVRVSPVFTAAPGSYRWRVWSLGAGGPVTFTPWRSLTVVQ